MKLVNHINLVTDEDFELLQVIGFVNDAIDRINTEVGANFPIIDDDLTNESAYQFEEYTALPDSWQRMLFVPFAAGRIKENDSSQFEYRDWYGQFDANLERFKTNYRIPDRYVDENIVGRRFEEDYNNAMLSPTKGW